MPIDPRQQDLWNRILAHRFDDPAARLTFTARLARENGWTIGQAVRVVDEYRRFVFLAMTAGHAVTPSEDVDQAWHLHLAYTRDYWETFCRDVLGQPLHHGPTRGGASEAGRYDHQYRQTLAAYAAVPLVAAGIPNPLDLTGPPFLMLFAALATSSIVAGFFLRRLFQPEGEPLLPGEQLEPLELALLADDGRWRCAATGLATLAVAPKPPAGAAWQGEPSTFCARLVAASRGVAAVQGPPCAAGSDWLLHALGGGQGRDRCGPRRVRAPARGPRTARGRLVGVGGALGDSRAGGCDGRVGDHENHRRRGTREAGRVSGGRLRGACFDRPAGPGAEAASHPAGGCGGSRGLEAVS